MATVTTAGSGPKTFRLPFLFIGTGMAGFAAFQLFSLIQGFGWSDPAGQPRGPSGWSFVHLAMLGWATMLAMGAVYQLIHVVLQTNIYSRKLGTAHFILFAIGAAGLVLGFGHGNTTEIAVSASIAYAGILLFAVNFYATLIRANRYDVVTLSAGAAVAYLVLAGTAGLFMGVDFAVNGLGEWHNRLFGAHLWFAAVGWFAFLITGFSYKMLPMFYLAHNVPTRWAVVTQWMLHAAVWIGVIGSLCNALSAVRWLALLSFAAGMVSYCVHIRVIQRHKHKKHPGSGIKFAVWCSRTAAVLAVAACLTLACFPEWRQFSAFQWTVGWAYLWGWVALTILGYMSKIVPFLWWTHRYGSLVGKQKTPSLAELISDRAVFITLLVCAVLSVIAVFGAGLNLSNVFRTSSSLLAVCSLFYMALIARIFTR